VTLVLAGAELRLRPQGGAVTMLETTRLALDALRRTSCELSYFARGHSGVTTLVVVMSFVAGMNFYVADRIAKLGANVFIVDALDHH